MVMGFPQKEGMYNPENEHDNCGIGFVTHIKGTPSHAIIERGSSEKPGPPRSKGRR